jgi:GxxExxY protein
LIGRLSKIILEIKAVAEIHDANRAQAINYLAATGFSLAILLNFGTPKLRQERLVRFNAFEKKS